ncbi:MAG: Flp pilus assembly complex ATPase component TadA, partial [Neisseriaceae bacterium]|nr:Flp pilus assembly complex ATPase component TadA [Neisseriaceae bacterium]
MNKTQPEKLNQEEKLRKQINSHYERLGFADLMKMDNVTEICINEEGIIFYEQSSIWYKKECPNNHSDTLICGLGTLLINHLKQNQKFDKNNPMLSQTMPDGERVQLVIPPAAEHASLTVRIPSKQVFSMEQYADFGLFEQIEQISSISDEDKELKELLNQKKFRLFL